MATKRNLRRSFGVPASPPPPGPTTYPDGSNPSTPGDPGFGQPMEYVSDLAPWRSPQYVPGAPQRLPGIVRGPVSPLIGGLPGAPSATTPTPGVAGSTAVLDPHHYANVVSATVAVPTTAIQTPFLPQPASFRNMLLLRNTDAAAIVYVDFGQSASANSPIAITPGQTYLFDEVVPQNDVYCFSATANVTLAYGFSNIPGF